MVGGNYIEPVIEQGCPQGIAVMCSLDSGITFDAVTQLFVIIGCEMKVMDTNLGCDPFLFQREHIAKKL